MKGIPTGYKFVRFDKPRTEETVLDAFTGKVRRAGTTTETYHVIVEAVAKFRPFSGKEEFMPFWDERVAFVGDGVVEYRIQNVENNGIYIMHNGLLFYNWNAAYEQLMFVNNKQPFGVEL